MRLHPPPIKRVEGREKNKAETRTAILFLKLDTTLSMI